MGNMRRKIVLITKLTTKSSIKVNLKCVYSV